MARTAAPTTYRAMAVFFLPLAAAQVFQTLRNPVLDAGISRAVDPETSLAAFAIVASVVQILSASGTAIQSAYLVLVRGRQSFAVIQRYMLLYMAVITGISTLFALPGIGETFFRFAMGTPESLLPEVMTMMRISLAIPLFNLLRVFNLAQLAHRRRSNLIWVAPAVGQVVLIALGLGVVPQLPVPGIYSAAVVWVIVAVIEGVLAVLLVRQVDRAAPYAPDPAGEAPLDFRYLTGFLIPLIITQFALTIGHPMVNAGLLRLPDPEATVGAFRVAFSLGMLPLTAMAALRQVVLVLGRDADQQRRARRFVYGVGLGMGGLMALIAFSPLNRVVIADLVGAPEALVPDAITALKILSVFPLLMAVRQFYQSMTMNQRRTRRVAFTAFSRLLMMASFLFLITPLAGWTGAGVGAVARIAAMGTEAGTAYLVGRRFFGMDPATRQAADKSASAPPVRPK
ncbi:MAG: hypothetical protein OXO54_01280 [Chloroflexota bacterium]|nr:hypothetical protein [Chloroflexota bacterium]MDE2896934.1 hypothetical protein [Chloroflexota bacterium]